MGNHVPATGILTELDALFAAFLAASAALTMLGLDALPIRAIVVIVVHVPMLRRVFARIGVIRRPLSHSQDSFRTSFLAGGQAVDMLGAFQQYP